MSNFQKVREWHEAFGAAIGDTPSLDCPTTLNDLRLNLIEEELDELSAAVEVGDIVEAADAIADLLYVVYGAGVTWGLPVDELFAEVHRSNMTKLGLDGKPILRDDGKILKGPNFEKPDIVGVLKRYAPQLEAA